MENFWTSMKLFLGKNAVELLCRVASAVEKVVDYLQGRRRDKARQQAESEIRKAEKKVDDACDKGGIDDLFDAAEAVRKASRKGRSC